MRIMLITPGFHSRYFWDFKKLGEIIGYSANNLLLALPTVAGMTPEKHEVILIDDNVEEVPFDAEVDLVGITAMTCYVTRAFAIADKFRERGVPVVMGGPHATLAPYEALEHVDSVVIGEAENVWETLLEDFELGAMKEVYRGVDAKPTMEANHRPAWHLVERTKYVFYGVEATRGCPFDCSFCSIKQLYGPDFRVRGADDVIAEIKASPSNQIFFTDDNLIGNKPFAKELFTKMAGLGVSWGCQMSINVGYMDKMLDMMKEAGCFFVFIGLETLDKEAVVAMNKPVNKMDYYKAIENIQSKGMFVIGSFILGSDNDTPETVIEIRDFVQESQLSWVMVNIMNSPPGTEMLKQMEAQGRNVVYSHDELDGAHATVTHPTMSRDQLEEGFRWLYRSVYDWDNLLERFSKTLSEGTWTQTARTLSVWQQTKAFFRLIREYVVLGSPPQRRFFFGMWKFLGRRVNRASIVNVLVLALSWNEFANALKPEIRDPNAKPIVFRREYMVPVADQTLGISGEASGVEREVARMLGPQLIQLGSGKEGSQQPRA
jgi:radical SAM superfamily enzyme YgiQ (UPF0313 family)